MGMNHAEGSESAADFLKQLEEVRSQFGKTGRFPMGKISDDDEGELQFGIANDKGLVVMNFGKPVAWFSMTPETAREMAATLIKHADEITARRAFMTHP